MNYNKTIHLDKSECTNRKSVPKKSQIAKYWREKIFELNLFMDWGEPACWACGRFESDNDVVDSKESLNDIFKVWDKQKYLERCHIVPKSMGGCNCHGNIVLLCKECHKDNPDTLNVELFLEWMQNRKQYPERRYETYKNAFFEFNIELNSLNIYLIHESQEFLNYFKSRSISVGKKYSAASILSNYKEWISDFSKKQLTDKVPKEMSQLINGKEKSEMHIKMILHYCKDIFIDNS